VAGPEAVANMALLPLGASGGLSLYSSTTANVIVDVQGFVTGPSSVASSDGLFVPLAPFRAADSRHDQGLARMGASFDQELALTLPAGSVSALAANVTVTDTWQAGFATVYPGRTGRPNVSNLNYLDNGTVAGFSLSAVGAGNTLNLMTASQADAIVDISGYFTGSPVVATALAPVKCSDLLTYLHQTVADLPDSPPRLMGRDLSGARPDWLISPAVFEHRLAPGCQYELIDEPFLGISRLDNLLGPSEPTDVTSNGVVTNPFATGVAISADAKTFWSADLLVLPPLNPHRTDTFLNTHSARTGAFDRTAVIQAGELRLGSIRADSKPVVIVTTNPEAGRDGPFTTCRFGIGGLWTPCAPAATAPVYTDFVLYPSGPIDHLATTATDGLVADSHLLASSGASSPRLTAKGDATAFIAGVGVVRWAAARVAAAGTTTPIAPDEVLLPSPGNSRPEFSAPLIRTVAPLPPNLFACGLTAPGC
jgi:hypothetical protein